MTPPIQAWAIKAPNGRISNYGLGRTKKKAIEEYLFDVTRWKGYYDQGYRCVRVTITEAQE